VNFLAEIFSCCGRPYCTDPYSPCSPYGFGSENRGNFGTIFEAVSRFLWLFLGRTEHSVHVTVGKENEVRKRPDSGTVLAQKTRQISVGQIWCCEVFSLAGNVVLLLICTFLKHNNKISLSLSLGFPTLGFSLAFA
jgi:hypothetical protein